MRALKLKHIRNSLLKQYHVLHKQGIFIYYIKIKCLSEASIEILPGTINLLVYAILPLWWSRCFRYICLPNAPDRSRQRTIITLCRCKKWVGIRRRPRANYYHKHQEYRRLQNSFVNCPNPCIVFSSWPPIADRSLHSHWLHRNNGPAFRRIYHGLHTHRHKTTCQCRLDHQAYQIYHPQK